MYLLTYLLTRCHCLNDTKWVVGLFIGCVLKWRHLLNTYEATAGLRLTWHLRRLWQHSPMLGLVVLACVPVCAVLRVSLLCSSCGLSAVKINEIYYYYYYLWRVTLCVVLYFWSDWGPSSIMRALKSYKSAVSRRQLQTLLVRSPSPASTAVSWAKTRYVFVTSIINPFTADPVKALHFAILV